MKRLFNYTKNLFSKVKTRIFLLICLVSLIPLNLAMSVLYGRSVYSMMNQAADIAHSTINVETGIANDAFKIVDYWSKKIVEEKDIADICEDSAEWDYEREVKSYQKAMNIFKSYLSQYGRFGIISNEVTYNLYIRNKKIIFDSSSTFYNGIKSENVDFLSLYDYCRERWTSTTQINMLNIIDKNNYAYSQQVVTKCYDITDNSGNVIGVLAVNVSSDIFKDYYNEIQKGLSGDTIFIDNYNNPILSSNAELMKSFMESNYYGEEIKGYWKEIRLGGERYLLVFGAIPSIEAKMYVLVPIRNIINNITDLKKVYLLLTIIIVILIIFIANLITRIFYHPIDTLKKSMYQVEQGKLNTHITKVRKDDLQEIYNSFNDMTDKLDSLVKEVTTEKLLNEEAELKLLQAQINPHFLYNTFDSIYSIAKLNKVDQISDMVAALSRFFRVSLSGGKNIVTMKEAAEIAESYLIIQNIRFMNKIQYTIHIEEVLGDVKVPKLIFQPIVENAVYHGLERKKGKGNIDLKAIVRDNHAFITIKDDGIGIEPLKLMEIKSSLLSENVETKYYAMSNLVRQLRLFYKETYSFHIESVCGEGTCVTIILPLDYDLKEDIIS